MSTKITSSLTEEKRHLRKQIGCMTGIFHHFLTGRHISSHDHERLFLAGQDQLEPQHATKAFIEKDMEPQKEKPRKSTESSQASHSSSSSSSSCLSTFSSLDSNKTARPQKISSQQTNIHQSRFHINTIKEERQSHDFRDVVKDSMNRETRGVTIKPIANSGRKGQAMKHVDSPRPLQQPKSENPKTANYEGSTQVFVEDEQLSLPRFSYDGRESRETFKSTMKLKEIPRLSLDSRASSMKSSAQESRSNFLRRDRHMENENSSQSLKTNEEPESRPLSSVIVAKLMGLDTLPDTISTNERTPKINSCIATQNNEKNHENNPNTPSPRQLNADSVRKLSQPVKRATFQTEPAPWKQKDVPPLSSSVYGEIEKRMTQLEFQKSGKDLRALKQILEAMHQTRERVECQTGQPVEFVLQKSNPPKKLGSSIAAMKPVKVTAKVNVSSSMEVPVSMPQLQKIRISDQRKDSVRKQEAKDVTPRNNYYLKDQKKNFSRNFEVDRTLRPSQRVMVENCSTSGRNVRFVSPRLQNETHSTIPTSNSDKVKKHSSKKLQERGSQSRKQKVTVKDRQITDDQLSELSSDTRYSSYQGDTASVKSESNNSRNGENRNFVYMSREDMASVELVVTTTEQPSPVSVLNAAFYNEDSPSPVKKLSTVFRDETPSPDEAEWRLENLNHLIYCKRSDHGYELNQKLENMENIAIEHRFKKTKPEERATTHSDGTRNPDHSYINMILQSSGILKDTHNKFNQKSERKVVFDLVNEILCRKISSNSSLTLARKRMSPQGIIKEIHLEIDRLQKTPDYNDDDEDEGMIKLLSADMMHQTEDWTGYSGEVPALALDIERLIFKDLINEVVMGEVAGLNARPKSHRRQLFSK